MGTGDGGTRLRGLYSDPARPLTVAVGPDFGLVSMPAGVGTAALAALRARRVRIGPVLADDRRAVMRVGFLLAPERGPGGHDASALRDWAARPGSALGVRIGGHGTTATLPPLLPTSHGWLRWLVPPGAGGAGWTPVGELWAALVETVISAALVDAAWGSGVAPDQGWGPGAATPVTRVVPVAPVAAPATPNLLPQGDP